MYNSSSGSSYGSNRAYSNNITNTSAASTSDSELDITGYWVYVNVSDSRFTESKKIMQIAEDKYESENMSLFNNELQGTVSKDVIVKNKNGDWESTTLIRRDYDNAIRTTTCLYEIKGNRMIVHCKYQTDFYSDSDFRNYRSTGEISEQDFIYTRK